MPEVTREDGERLDEGRKGCALKKKALKATRGRREETESMVAPTFGTWMASEKKRRTDEEQGRERGQFYLLKTKMGLLLSYTSLGWPGHSITWLSGAV